MDANGINKLIQDSNADTNKISDGFHTFRELYDHRVQLFINYCNLLDFVNRQSGLHGTCWKSKKHSDGSGVKGWFVAGIGEDPGEQITYHLPTSRWKELKVSVKKRAPKWDRHTPKDVLKRLKKL